MLLGVDLILVLLSIYIAADCDCEMTCEKDLVLFKLLLSKIYQSVSKYILIYVDCIHLNTTKSFLLIFL